MCPSFTSTSSSPSEACPEPGFCLSPCRSPQPALSSQRITAIRPVVAAGMPLGSMPHYSLQFARQILSRLPSRGAAAGLCHSRAAGTKQMVALDDDGRSLRARAAAGAPAARQRPPVRPGLRREGPVRHRRQPSPPTAIRTGPAPMLPATATAPVVTALLQAGARLVGKTKTMELAYGLTGENVWQGTPLNPARPGPVSRRLELRLGRRGGRRPGRFRARLGYRRLGAHPGKLLRPVRHPSEPTARSAWQAPARWRPASTPAAGSPAAPRCWQGSATCCCPAACQAWTGRCCGSRRPG